MNVAGIDVGSEELVLVIGKGGAMQKPRSYANNPTDHAAIIKALRSAKVTRVCIEATGVYHLDLAVALHDAGGLDVMVVNPKAARRFAEAMMNRTKTDPVDAALLAEFAVRMPFVAWVRSSDEVLALRAYGRYLAALTKQCTQLKTNATPGNSQLRHLRPSWRPSMVRFTSWAFRSNSCAPKPWN